MISEIRAMLWLLQARILNLARVVMGLCAGASSSLWGFSPPSLAFPKREAPAVLSHLQGLALPSSSQSSIPESRVEIPLRRVSLQIHPWQSPFPRAQC